MHTDPITERLVQYDGQETLLERLRALPPEQMILGDSEAPSTLFSQAVALAARGEPICIGLMDCNPILIMDPPMMGYFLGTGEMLDSTIEWCEELGAVLHTMAANLKETRSRLAGQPDGQANATD
jgi:hypothetical protein